MGYNCDEHPDRQAAVLLTNLTNGASFTMCGECVPVVLRAVAGIASESADAAAPNPAPGVEDQVLDGAPDSVELEPVERDVPDPQPADANV